MQTFFERDYIEVSFDAKNNWIYANWKGYQSDASVVEGCEAILAAMSHFSATKVLNDNRLVQGIWTGVADWLARDWFQRMRIAGMKRFALLYSPSRLSRISADAAMLPADPESRHVRGFDDERLATIWLAMTDIPANPQMDTSQTAQGSEADIG
ncbi:MAG TPA: hypothetical protein VIM12_05945 [Noviherbaspirillum sp.]|jgi:hypothetical protein|uniref:hypothetical protein n=1 Tax=Noviherbaspirillum sp. TaxID=1926288 RepID=UPI002F9304CC